MGAEVNRQLVHISGFVFVLLAQFIGQLITAWFFFMAGTLFIYSLYIRQEQKRLWLLHKLEGKVRDITLSLERKEIPMPFIGAIWFFFASGLAFLLFPHLIASAAVLVLVVGDGLATLVGVKLGRHMITGKKSLEGSIACFAGSLSALAFLDPLPVLAAAIAAAIIEIIPELGGLKGLRKKGIVDDNWMIPIFVGILLYLIAF